ncbi:serine/threonine-protein kinase [Streptomyces fradiae]|uniref:non-specific serine/threonine protein kinase n=4 Tax=Streptomyces TaxID=1883 RepID=A0ABQ6XRP4_STRFR|nr:serine/threonine-protein kinase [Streptomyces fradiae]KAF0648416.1 protein kinase [Streptomyces fradiae ATCC 10745 = DSM 40063]
MTASARPCTRPGCTGTLMATGFCGTCHRLPPAPGSAPAAGPPAAAATLPASTPGPAPAAPAAAPAHGPAPAPSARRPAGAAPALLDHDGLVLLPHLEAPDPGVAASPTARPPTGGRRCGYENCTGVIGVAYDGAPAPDRGFCPECGHPYSFEPRLRPGDTIGGHYRVLGYLAVGGLGWVYLAEDTKVPDHLVVLKGLINSGDAVARRSAVEERRSLTTLHHRDIVRIITHVQHRAPGDDEPTGYIVMEYIAGRSLAWLRYASDEELTAAFGRPFGIDHVITYGCKILGALEYLHDQGLLYCDMKPENVIHYGRDIKVIDLGAIRRVDDRTSGLVYTRDYAPPRSEREQRGFHVDTDLYTVGRTLQVLAARAEPASGLAARSFEALIRRATHPDPAARFTSAAEMSRQLWEVLREQQALKGHEPYPERSTRFAPTAALFGAALGSVPEADRWAGADTDAPRPLPVAAPGPREVVSGLPVPIPDPDDPAAALLAGLAAHSPERVAGQAARDPALGTVEAALWLCRAFAHRGDPDGAGTWLDEAARRGAGAYDWRLSWHRGLVRLTEGHVRSAEEEFAAVYAALPGEWAPKLALGYCAEYLNAGAAGARDYYEAVWQRDRTQGSAAFGLARLQLRGGDRAAAVAVLDGVPSTSRHHDAARVAAVRALAGRLPHTGTTPGGAGGPGGGPGAGELREAAERLAALARTGEDRAARERLLTEVRECALACRPPGGWGAAFPAGEVLGEEDDVTALSRLLSRSLRGLADEVRDGGLRDDLLDRSYAVLPPPRLRLVAAGRRGKRQD